MKDKRNDPSSYELRPVIIYGAAASSSLLLLLLILLFLNSQISDHIGPSTDTIGEMMGYAEFFIFSFASYFATSVFVWRHANYFSRFGPSWLPIALLGSITFSVSFYLLIWVSSIITFSHTDPFQNPPPSVGQLTLGIFIFAGICFVISSIGCGFATLIHRYRQSPEESPLITQKY